LRIIEALPPNFETIQRFLPVVGKEIFAYGNIIYNPSGGQLPNYLIAHEEIHERQQGGSPEGWWGRYLKDEEFRLQQELEAHRVEWRVFQQEVKDRNKRSIYLHWISRRLSHKMYGSLVTLSDAKKLIKERI